MSRKSQQLNLIVPCTFAFLLYAALASPMYAVSITTDGDFGAQVIGNPIAAPWTPNNNVISATAAAQSNFTNAFANNGKGATSTKDAGGYFVQSFAPFNYAGSTGTVHLNVDFQNTTAGTGYYTLQVVQGADALKTSAAAFINGTNLVVWSGNGTTQGVTTNILNNLTLNTWYNLQFDLDLASHKYSGQVTEFGGATTLFSNLDFVTTGFAINSVYTDGGSGSGVAGLPFGDNPTYNLDNFAITYTGPPTPALTVDFNGNTGPALTRENIGTAQFPAGNGQYYNNLNGTSFTNAPLLDHNGNATGITLSSNAPNVENSTSSDPTGTGTQAFRDTLVTLGQSITPNDPSDDVGTITLNGLDSGKPYDLYLFGYFTPDDTNREATQFTVNALTPQSTTGALSGTTGFTLGEDYVKFSSVAPISGAITIAYTGGNPLRDVGVFNGFQLVAVPEPTAFGLIAVGLAGLARFRRRYSSK